MGQFSWLDCKNKEQVLDNVVRDVYVLIPKEFGGGHIKEPCYDGYGNFGIHDIYDLLADWNKEYLSEDLLKDVPKKSGFGGLWGYEKEALKAEGKTEEEIAKADDEAREGYYQAALRRRQVSICRMKDFKSGMKDDYMVVNYGPDWKRLIGIDIGCYDEQNAALPYPIKITHDPKAVYEDCEPSLSDPNQGWQVIDDDEEEEW